MKSQRENAPSGREGTPGARRGRPRDSTVDTRILHAVLDLFVERGFAGVGIEQVAERAGVARTTVYRRVVFEGVDHRESDRSWQGRGG